MQKKFFSVKLTILFLFLFLIESGCTTPPQNNHPLDINCYDLKIKGLDLIDKEVSVEGSLYLYPDKQSEKNIPPKYQKYEVYTLKCDNENELHNIIFDDEFFSNDKVYLKAQEFIKPDELNSPQRVKVSLLVKEYHSSNYFLVKDIQRVKQ